MKDLSECRWYETRGAYEVDMKDAGKRGLGQLLVREDSVQRVETRAAQSPTRKLGEREMDRRGELKRRGMIS